ncbi:hypothetical protein QUA81_20915 [Microcoleus sp. F6_B4]
MSDITGNQEGIMQAEEEEAFLMGQMAQSTGDYFALLGRDDEAKGEYLAAIAAYEQVLSDSANFAEANKNKEAILKSIGQFSEKVSLPKTEETKIGAEELFTTKSDNFIFYNSVNLVIKKERLNSENSLLLEILPELSETISSSSRILWLKPKDTVIEVTSIFNVTSITTLPILESKIFHRTHVDYCLKISPV